MVVLFMGYLPGYLSYGRAPFVVQYILYGANLRCEAAFFLGFPASDFHSMNETYLLEHLNCVYTTNTARLQHVTNENSARL